MNLLESTMFDIVGQTEHMLPSNSITEIDNLIRLHGEYGLALELLCSVLEEFKLAISQETYSSIIDLFVKMEFTADQINYYKSHLIIE